MTLPAATPSRAPRRAPALALRPRRGVTLVEMGIVLVIIGLIAAMVIPRIGRGIAARELDRVSQTLASDLKTAGQLAARHRRPVRFQAVGTTGYEIVDKATPTSSFVKRDFGTDRGNATFGTLPTIDFYPNGILGVVNTSLAFPLTMTVTVNGSSRTVTVSRIGYVRRP